MAFLQGSQSDLPLALQVDQATFDRMYKRGFDDADHRRKLDSFGDKFKRGIGKIRTAPLHEETVSWIWLLDPSLQAYSIGWNARHLFQSTDEIAKIKEPFIKGMAQGRRHLYFTGQITILPSFGGYGGRIDHRSTPEELKGVRVVLKVGDRVYQPQQQPGDLEYKAGIGESEHTDTEFSTTFSTWGSWTSYYNVVKTQKYDYYLGRFSVCFDLFDHDGTARVKRSDKKVTAVVIYGPNEREATYDMDDIFSIIR